MLHNPTPTIENFITRWKASGVSERANYQLFLTELCELLGVEKPQPATDKVHEATHTFERPMVFDDGEGKTSTNFIDLYKKDCFVQGADKATVTEAELLGTERAKNKTSTYTRTWDREMKKAKEQGLCGKLGQSGSLCGWLAVPAPNYKADTSWCAISANCYL